MTPAVRTLLLGGGGGGITIPQGIIGRWSFDDGNGLVAADSSGNGNNATLVNSPAWIAGQIKGGISFSGANSAATLSTARYAFGAGDFSIALWLKNTSGGGGLVTQTSAGIGSWAILLSAGSMFWQSQVAVTNLYSRSAAALLDGAWHFVVVSRIGTSNVMYFDGVQQGTATTDTVNYGVTSVLTFGTFTGSQDEVVIRNIGLTQSQVAQIYAAGLAGRP